MPDQLTKLTTEGAKSSWLLPHKHQCSQSFHVSANFRRFLAFLINFCTDSAAESNNSAVNSKQRVNKSPFMAIFWEPDPESHGTLVLPRQCLTVSIFELDPTYGYQFDFSLWKSLHFFSPLVDLMPRKKLFLKIKNVCVGQNFHGIQSAYSK